mgnify:CR=1 FL=1
MAVLIKIWDHIEDYCTVSLTLIALALLCGETVVRFFDAEMPGQWRDDITIFLILLSIFI